MLNYLNTYHEYLLKSRWMWVKKCVSSHKTLLEIFNILLEISNILLKVSIFAENI